jgi:hypothetical protein
MVEYTPTGLTVSRGVASSPECKLFALHLSNFVQKLSSLCRTTLVIHSFLYMQITEHIKLVFQVFFAKKLYQKTKKKFTV